MAAPARVRSCSPCEPVPGLADAPYLAVRVVCDNQSSILCRAEHHGEHAPWDLARTATECVASTTLPCFKIKDLDVAKHTVCIRESGTRGKLVRRFEHAPRVLCSDPTGTSRDHGLAEVMAALAAVTVSAWCRTCCAGACATLLHRLPSQAPRRRPLFSRSHTHARAHARTHARTHTRTHAHKLTHAPNMCPVCVHMRASVSD